MQTGTILDAHEAQSPRHWWQRRVPPTALQLATAALEECRRDQLDHKHKAEYHTAMHKMLEERDKRLQKDIARLSKRAPAGVLDSAE